MDTHNRIGIIVAMLLLLAAAISCALVRDLAGSGESEKSRKLNESVPTGMKTAELDYDLTKPSAFKIILPEPDRVLLGNADAEPIDVAALESELKALYANATPDRRVVYVIVAANVPTADVAAILDKIRDVDISIVRLVTRSRPLDEDRGLFTKVPPPDRVIEVKVRKEVMSYRPNPFTLLITTGPDGMPLLNNDSNEDLDTLTNRLTEIFKQREANGVFREGTNEVEKTVLIDVPRGDPNRNYGELVNLVNAVKLATAQPIVLGDKNKFIQMPEGLQDRKELLVRPLTLQGPASIDHNKKEPPKTISGGVLNGKALELPKPAYPPAARAVRASGAVSVRVLVDREGNVVSATAVSGHPLLRPAAVQAARSARFAPTLLSGQPVSISGVLTYNFVP